MTAPRPAEVDVEELERLEKAALMAPWEVVVQPVKQSPLGVETGLCANKTRTMIATSWEHGQLKGKMPVVEEWCGPYTAPNVYANVRPENAALIVAMRNALPALLQLVRTQREALALAHRAMADLNGHVSLEKWQELYEPMAAIRAALRGAGE